MILIRYLLICIIGYLLVRSFVKFGEEEKLSHDNRGKVKNDNAPKKKVSKQIGEYVDYEEVKKK